MAGRGRKSEGGDTASSPISTTLVLDNGAYTIKAGFVTQQQQQPPQQDGDGVVDNNQPRIIPNCIARDRQRKTYVGSELARCRDFGEAAFRRPVEKGSIVNWEGQREIWQREFFDPKAPMRCDPDQTRLVLAEQPNSLPALQGHCDQIVFEEFGFASYYRGIGPAFNAYNDIQSAVFKTPRAPDAPPDQCPAEALLLIDSGYSHTTVTPVLQGRPLQSAIRRLDIGGKLMTNYLTRLLSVRHFDMRNEPYVVNEMKEAACYVSLDFRGDLDKTWKGTRGERREPYISGAGIAKDYVLPDSHTRFHGTVREYQPRGAKNNAAAAAAAAGSRSALANEDVLTLRNERFAVPELLFHPSDIGMRQPGLPDVVMQSLEQLPIGLWPAMLSNVVLVGGSALFEKFAQRLEGEIRERVPEECVPRVARPDDPITATWKGAANFARHEHIGRLAVTRQEYEEHGAGWVARKFAAGLGSGNPS